MAGRTTPAKDNELKALVNDSIPKVFWRFDFYDQDRLNSMERKILNHFLFREIAMTPVSRWLYMFNSHLDTVLPYYSDVMKALSEKYDPLVDVDYTEETESDESGSKQTSETSTKDIVRKMLETGADETTENRTGKDTHGGSTTEAEATESSKNTRYEHDTNDLMTDRHDVTSTDTYDLTNGNSVTRGVNKSETVETTGRDTTNSDTNKNRDTITTQNDTPTTYLDAFLQNAYMTSANKVDDGSTEHLNGTVSHTNQDRTTGSDDSTETGEATQTGTVQNTTGDMHTITDKDHMTDNTREGLGSTRDKTVTDNRTVDTVGSMTGSVNRDIDRNETGKDTGSAQGNESDSREGHVIKRVKGKTGGKTYAQMLREYMDNLANVEAMVIDELEQFFFMIYGEG